MRRRRRSKRSSKAKLKRLIREEVKRALNESESMSAMAERLYMKMYDEIVNGLDRGVKRRIQNISTEGPGQGFGQLVIGFEGRDTEVIVEMELRKQRTEIAVETYGPRGSDVDIFMLNHFDRYTKVVGKIISVVERAFS